MNLRQVTLLASLILTCKAFVLAQGIDVKGGKRLEGRRQRSDHFSNRSPVEISPPPPSPSEKSTFADLQDRLEFIIDAKHGYLKSLRFPALFVGDSARSIDRYIMLDGPIATRNWTTR